MNHDLKEGIKNRIRGKNMKKVAIITGATGGIGQLFVREIEKEPVDEIWVIGRSEERLLALRKEFGDKIVPIPIDLTKEEQILAVSNRLKEQHPWILWLVNNAGIAKMAPSVELSTLEISQTIDLNCKASTILIQICFPYMQKGSKILNVSSASAFQPVPYLNLYAATKVFERSYSRALHQELKPFAITVTAVCPGWVDTNMLIKNINGKKVHFPGMVNPEKVVYKAIKDAKKGKDMSVCSLYVKCLHLNVKLLPQKLVKIGRAHV